MKAYVCYPWPSCLINRSSIQYIQRYSILQHAVISATVLRYTSLIRLVHIHVRYHGYCAYACICIARHTGRMISKLNVFSVASVDVEMARDVNWSKFLDPSRPNPISNRPIQTRPTNIWEGHDPTQPDPNRRLLCSSALIISNVD